MRNRILMTMLAAIMLFATGFDAEARPRGHRHGWHKKHHRYMHRPPRAAYRPYVVVAPGPPVHYQRVWVPGYWRPAYRGNVWVPGYWTRRPC